MLMAGRPPRWVIDRLREFCVDGLTCSPVAGHELMALHPRLSNYPSSVKRLKIQHRIHIVSKITPMSCVGCDVDATACGGGELGAAEGYRWIASAVNKALAQRVGVERGFRALRRVDRNNRLLSAILS